MVIATAAIFTGGFPDVTAGGYEISASPEGGWTWFTDPRAIQYNGIIYYGYQRGSDGSVVVGAWDEDARAHLSTTVLHSALESDDHDNPGLYIRMSDGKMMCFYGKHAETAATRYRVSTSAVASDPDLSDGFAAETNVTNQITAGGALHTYAMPVQLSAESGNPLRLFNRTHIGGTDPELTYNRTDDDGATWAAAVRTHDLTYTKIAQTDDDIHFFASQHPGDITGPGTVIYHFYLDTTTPAWRQTDGTVISPLGFPKQPSELTVVYDAGSTPLWVHDLAMDGDTPVGVFATFPTTTDHRYWYARWNGSAWVATQICTAGTYIVTDLSHDANQVYYSGGVALDQDDPRFVYASRQVGSAWEMFCYFTDDDGATFHEAQLTSDGAKNIRPVAVRNPDRTRVLWMRGTYNDYLDYAVATWGSRGST